MKKAESYHIPDSLEMQWLALSLVSGLGYRSIQRLLDSGKTLADMLQATPGALIRDLGIKAELARKISSAAHASGYLMEKRLLQESPEIRLYCPESEAYPLQLKEIESPPGVLYWKGIEGLAEQPCLAFVGSRACSGYGLKHTKRLILELAEAQPELVIVSGMARGIDTVAHETALEAGLKTIAVLAGGLNHLYPPENKHLATRIQKKGALITEFPMAVKPLAKHFPIRNRVISGLSLGVVVSEARLKSGANITAAFALQQNREVFALPGQVDSEASAGTNRLISRQHAKLITRADEILEELQFGQAKTKQPLLQLFQAPKVIKLNQFSELEKAVLKIIKKGIEELNDLHVETGISMSQLQGVMLELELKGIIQQNHSSYYSIKENIVFQKDKI